MNIQTCTYTRSHTHTYIYTHTYLPLLFNPLKIPLACFFCSSKFSGPLEKDATNGNPSETRAMYVINGGIVVIEYYNCMSGSGSAAAVVRFETSDFDEREEIGGKKILLELVLVVVDRYKRYSHLCSLRCSVLVSFFSPHYFIIAHFFHTVILCSILHNKARLTTPFLDNHIPRESYKMECIDLFKPPSFGTNESTMVALVPRVKKKKKQSCGSSWRIVIIRNHFSSTLQR